VRHLTAVVLCIALATVSFAQSQTSFQAVTSHLDSGGDLFLYVNTEQWLRGLSVQMNQWRDVFMAVPGQSPADQENVRRLFDLLTRLVKNSGIEEVRGFGMSSIARGQGLYRNTAMLYHDRGNSSGYLWSVFGKTPHAMDGVNLLPANTALASFTDLDLPMLWSILDKEVGQSGIPAGPIRFGDRRPTGQSARFNGRRVRPGCHDRRHLLDRSSPRRSFHADSGYPGHVGAQGQG
jgi:hypothetical protein